MQVEAGDEEKNVLSEVAVRVSGENLDGAKVKAGEFLEVSASFALGL